MVTGQAPVTLEWRNTPKIKHEQNQKRYAHISKLTQFLPPPEKYKKVKSGVGLRCARSILVHTSHYSRLKKPDYTACRTQRRLPRIHYTCYTYHDAYARQTKASWKKEEKRKINYGDTANLISLVRPNLLAAGALCIEYKLLLGYNINSNRRRGEMKWANGWRKIPLHYRAIIRLHIAYYCWSMKDIRFTSERHLRYIVGGQKQ